MITGELKSKIDAVWNAFWTGGISNPMEVIELNHPGLLYEAPFTGLHYEGVDGLFDDGDVRQIISSLALIKDRAAA